MRRMHLSDYMAGKNLRDEDVAAAIGKSRVSVSRWRRRLVRPDWDSIEAIREFSKQAVQADDWRVLAQEAAE
jgi:transcriptional regulator with XRE-family HTH domain